MFQFKRLKNTKTGFKMKTNKRILQKLEELRGSRRTRKNLN